MATPVAADLARYIRQEQLDKPVVIGHSMGGTIAMMLAARQPTLVGKLMVVDMIPFMGAMFGGPQATAQSVQPMADMVATGMRSSPPEAWQAQAAQTIAGMINTEAARAGPIQDSVTSDQNVAAASMRELITTDLRPELARITAPTEVLYVKFNDARMTDEDHRRHLCRLLRQSARRHAEADRRQRPLHHAGPAGTLPGRGERVFRIALRTAMLSAETVLTIV